MHNDVCSKFSYSTTHTMCISIQRFSHSHRLHSKGLNSVHIIYSNKQIKSFTLQSDSNYTQYFIIQSELEKLYLVEFFVISLTNTKTLQSKTKRYINHFAKYKHSPHTWFQYDQSLAPSGCSKTICATSLQHYGGYIMLHCISQR